MVSRHKKIVIVSYILHNYLMGVDPDEILIDEVDREITNQNNYQKEHHVERDDSGEAAKGELIRDSIAAVMWLDYSL